jgi:exodeoxyribonuclease VII large subunit
MIAFTNAITPTKLAEYLLQKFHNFAIPVRQAEKKIFEKTVRLLDEAKMKFGSEVKLFRSVTDNVLISNNNEIKTCRINIVKATTAFCNVQKIILTQLKEKTQVQSLLITKDALAAINGIEKNVDNMSPANVLKRGYSITLLNGKSVADVSQVKDGDVLNTLVHNGSIASVVNSTHKNNIQ